MSQAGLEKTITNAFAARDKIGASSKGEVREAVEAALELLDRGEARRVQYITGHGRDGELPNDIDWKSLADPAATTVVYMPVKTLPALVAHACDAGLNPATPAVAVAHATRAEERTIAASISDLPAELAAAAPSGPVIVMIGRVFADYGQETTGETAPIAAARQA